jgi:hypothetical protein
LARGSRQIDGDRHEYAIIKKWWWKWSAGTAVLFRYCDEMDQKHSRTNSGHRMMAIPVALRYALSQEGIDSPLSEIMTKCAITITSPKV